ncbi:hypothetical protein NQ317_010104 [Molorchus minor]|uniref:Focal AT domain-containing protein n=1 Tax=Molorchus minor TaxID=1323400 RepID=A0ABQ9IYM8_9CUCU|nr:hypothetical protein NQ317_010104 [Molorchus minor]
MITWKTYDEARADDLPWAKQNSEPLGMLAAAHVLAMDSKNLLDVVDTIRIRYPQINKTIFKSNDSLPESDQNPPEKHDFSKPTDNLAYPHSLSPTPSPSLDPDLHFLLRQTFHYIFIFIL